METAVYIGLVTLGVVVVAALCFMAYLLFLRFVINKTGTTDGLPDVAKAISAYKVPLPSRSGHKPPAD
jgi:hypothetical protein